MPIAAVLFAKDLAVFGDNSDNSATISRDAAGTILVNGGAVAVSGGTPTIANTSWIEAYGQAGADTLSLNETNGAMPPAVFYGGDGNDVLMGGSVNDFLYGGNDSDTLVGQGGNDTLSGDAGADLMWGGTGYDLLSGGTGRDTATFAGNRSDYVVNLLQNGTVQVVDQHAGSPFGTDTLSSVEQMLFYDGAFAPVAPLGDVLWRHSEGSVAAGDAYLGEVSTNFDIAGTGDFDGDGDADILWRNVDGRGRELGDGRTATYVQNHNLAVRGNQLACGRHRRLRRRWQ